MYVLRLLIDIYTYGYLYGFWYKTVSMIQLYVILAR